MPKAPMMNPHDVRTLLRRDHDGVPKFARELLDALLDRMARSRRCDSEEWEALAKELLDVVEQHTGEEHAGTFEAPARQFDDDVRAASGPRFRAYRARHLMKARAA